MSKALAEFPIDLPETSSAKKPTVPETAFVPPPMPAPKKGRPATVADLKFIAEYNRLDDEMKRLKAQQERIGVLLKEQGLGYVVRHNVENASAPNKQIASVSLLDPIDHGSAPIPVEKVMFSMQNKYCKFDRAQAEAAIGMMGRKTDVEQYLCWKLEAVFDTSVFYEKDVFSKDRFDTFMGAMAQAAEQAGVANPLSLSKSPAVRDDFHQRRWADFTAEQNLALQKVLACTLSLKSVRPQG